MADGAGLKTKPTAVKAPRKPLELAPFAAWCWDRIARLWDNLMGWFLTLLICSPIYVFVFVLMVAAEREGEKLPLGGLLLASATYFTPEVHGVAYIASMSAVYVLALRWRRS